MSNLKIETYEMKMEDIRAFQLKENTTLEDLKQTGFFKVRCIRINANRVFVFTDEKAEIEVLPGDWIMQYSGGDIFVRDDVCFKHFFTKTS